MPSILKKLHLVWQIKFQWLVIIGVSTAVGYAAPAIPQVVTDFRVKVGKEGPEGVGYDAAAKQFYFVSGSTIYRSNQTGRSVRSMKGVRGVRYRGITRTSDGCLIALASSSSEVHVFSAKGKLDRKIKLPVSKNYRALACSPDKKTIYLSERTKITVLDTVTGYTKDFGVKATDIQGIALTAKGDLWVVDDETLTLTLFNKQARTKHTLALGSITKYVDPEGLCLDENKKILYVSFDDSAALIGIDISKHQ